MCVAELPLRAPFTMRHFGKVTAATALDYAKTTVAKCVILVGLAVWGKPSLTEGCREFQLTLIRAMINFACLPSSIHLVPLGSKLTQKFLARSISATHMRQGLTA